MHKPRIKVPGWLRVVLVAAVFSLALSATAVRGEYDLGPGKIEIAMRPQWSGATIVAVPPFGTVTASTHRSPVAVIMSPQSVDILSAQQLVESRPNQRSLVASLRADLESALRKYAFRLLLGGLLAALIAAGVARARKPAEFLAAIAVGALVPVGLYAAAFAGYNADAFRQPTLTGALSRSPELLGPVQQFGSRFNTLRSELDQIGSITFQLYQFLARQSPIPEDAIRILHIADLHLNPVGYDVSQQVAERFEVAAVIDSGDVTAEGTPVESPFVERISEFTVPYLFIRGNHDSLVTQDAVAAQPNALVLDGAATEVEGLTIFGIGDPLYTPDKTVEQPSNQQQREAKLEFSETVRDRVGALQEPPDVVVVHDRLTAVGLHGRVPLILHGHEHKWGNREEEGTLVLGVGSTGAAGLKSLAPDSNTPISLQVLYFDREGKQLLGYDRIEVRGSSQQFTLNRTIVSPLEPDETGTPDAEPEETPSPGGEPADAALRSPAAGVQPPQGSPAP